MLLGFAEKISRNRHHQVREMTLLSPAHRRADLGSFEMRSATKKIDDVILPTMVRDELDRFFEEQAKADLLLERGLAPKRKLLFHGGSGTGKTMVAETIATALALPFYVLHVSRMIDSHLGSSLKNLDAAFAAMEETPGVFLFDEFDAIGLSRGSKSDVSEMARVVSGLLVLIEGLQSNSILIASTNQPSLLDGAFRRRFDVICHFPDPTKEQRADLIAATAKKFGFTLRDGELDYAGSATFGLSFHETEDMILNAIKTSTLSGAKELDIHREINLIQSRIEAFTQSP